MFLAICQQINQSFGHHLFHRVKKRAINSPNQIDDEESLVITEERAFTHSALRQTIKQTEPFSVVHHKRPSVGRMTVFLAMIEINDLIGRGR
jgi:hypothetical protein